MKITSERIFTGIVVIVVLAAALSMTMRNGHNSTSIRPPAPAPTSAGAVPKVEITNNNTSENPTVGSVKLDSATKQDITDAVRIWSEYPNHEGRKATLAKLQLNRSVTTSALADVSRQWARQQAGLVKVTLVGSYLADLPVYATNTQVTFEGAVTLDELFIDNKTTRVSNSVDVLLTKVGGVWKISRLVTL